MGSSKQRFFLDLFESSSKQSAIAPTCKIDLRVRFRYQLRIPSNEGTVIVVEDIVSPEWRTSHEVPIVFPLSAWRELYLTDVIKGFKVDDSLKPRIVDAAVTLAESRCLGGFGLVVKVGELKMDLMGQEEADRIAAKVAKVD